MDGKNIEIIRSARKTLALQVTKELRIIVRAPQYMPQEQIIRFVAEKSPWIEKQLCKLAQQAAQEKESPLTARELYMLRKEAQHTLPRRAAYFAQVMGVVYGSITVRRQTSRWGSCSTKGNLSFNCLLMLCPQEVQDYVVVHELCHLREMNHSPAFWSLVACYCPDYARERLWLKQNGGKLIERLKTP